VDGERVAAAGVVEREQASAHRRDDFRLAPDDPASGRRRRQIRDRQRAPVRTDDIFDPGTKRLCHAATRSLEPTHAASLYAFGFKIYLSRPGIYRRSSATQR